MTCVSITGVSARARLAPARARLAEMQKKRKEEAEEDSFAKKGGVEF